MHNPRFHAAGRSAADGVRSPNPDATFDVVCAFAVFMHVDLAGVRNYLAEIARVLRPGGVAVLSFQAIWDYEDEPVLGERPFVAIGGGVHTRFPERQEAWCMGYRVDLIRELFRDRGFEPVAEIEGIRHSPWTERPPGPVHNCDLFAVRRPTRE